MPQLKVGRTILGVIAGYVTNAVLVGITEAIGIPCLVVWALFGSSMKALLATPRNRRIFSICMALALAATAVVMVAK